jgi:FkbM family methyltransferase
VSVVLDVGASVGEFGSALRAEGYAGRIVSFEPSSAAFGELERRAAGDGAWECRRMAVGDAEGWTDLRVAENGVSSSLLRVTREHLRVAPRARAVRVERVPVARLDTLAPELLRPDDRTFLKLDVQGGELAALRGAEAVLGRLAGIECELSLVELYEGQPVLGHVTEWLGERGFALVALEPALTDPASGELLQLDGLFVRRAESEPL